MTDSDARPIRRNNLPFVVGVVNEKGGCGKTTTVVNLADAFSAKGYSVVVIDLDHQGSSAEFSSSKFGGKYPIQKISPPLKRIDISVLMADIVIIDGPPGIENDQVREAYKNYLDTLSEDERLPTSVRKEIEVFVASQEEHLTQAIASVVDLADFILLPCKASRFDIRATLRTVKNIVMPKLTSSRKPKYGVMVNECRPATQMYNVIKKQMNSLNLNLMKSNLGDRQGFTKTAFLLTTVVEKPNVDREATKEVLALCDEILKIAIETADENEVVVNV